VESRHIESLLRLKREEKNSRKKTDATWLKSIARPDETFRSDITASNSLWSIILQSLLSPILQEAGTFFEGSGKSVVRVAGQKNAFIKRCFSFCVFVRESNSSFPFDTFAFVRSYLFSHLTSFGRYFASEHPLRGCDRGSFARIFHEFIFLLQERVNFFLLLNWCTKRLET